MTAAPSPLFFRQALAILPGLCALALLPGCDNEENPASTAVAALPPAPTLVESDTFVGQNACTHCAALCALGPRPSGSPAYLAQLEYLEAQLKASGWQVRREEFAPLHGMRMVNLHASFGPGADTRPLLISCHIDTKAGIPGFVGADDGASAAAVMLEAARVLASQQPTWAKQVELIFFDGEEAFGKRMNERDGMYGSKHDVARRQAQGPAALPRWQVNLDMVGGRDLLIAIPLLDTTEAMVEQYQRAVDALQLSPERWSAYPGSYLDDHLPYVQAGVDSLNLIAWFQGGGWWHTTRDNMSRISAHSLEESGRVLLQLCRQLLGGE